MSGMLGTLALLLAVACVFAMGYAIQRGGTCTVAAVDEIVASRRAHRLAAMLEAALWVAGALAIAAALDRLPVMPASYAVTGWTVAGGALLGLGAWLGSACVFGAIARFGSGQWAYAATPLGFYVACLSIGRLFPADTARPLAEPAPLLQMAGVPALAFAAYAVWRLVRARPRHAGAGARWTGLARQLGDQVWSPHAATIVIGITFVATWLLAGRWTYTELLVDLAHDMAGSVAARTTLFAALLGGAVFGGWTAGRLGSSRVTLAQLARCFGGGVLMGWGTLLIPGANDGLILVGLPLLRPYAWLAFGTMCVAIGAAIGLQRAWQGRAADHPLAHGG
jgi:toxin CptA